MESEGSFPYSQKAATGRSSEADGPVLTYISCFFKIRVKIVFLPRLGFPHGPAVSSS
jgi:hypothetical protein